MYFDEITLNVVPAATGHDIAERVSHKNTSLLDIARSRQIAACARLKQIKQSGRVTVRPVLQDLSESFLDVDSILDGIVAKLDICSRNLAHAA